ncbi:MAG: hypothetical protein FJY88_00635 [Candidatus Eisenbacteria bacterium]|nr:hypothetical protein [Candidatus Eisenbacteria bacterium]
MRRWIGLLAVLCLTTLVSCGDDDKKSTTGPGDQNQEHDGTITAAITGDFQLDFTCADAYGLKVEPQEGLPGSMHIQGDVTLGSDQYMIDIQVYHDPATGTFDLTFPPVDGVGSIIKNSRIHYSETGSVTISQVSASRMEGTFSFHAFSMVSPGQRVDVDVMEGTFDVPVILAP